MRRYFDAGWDERINQNIYRNPLIADEVKKKIQSVSDSSASLDIQRSKTKFNMLNKRYKDYSRYLLNIGNTPKEHINELRRQLKLALKNRLLP